MAAAVVGPGAAHNGAVWGGVGIAASRARWARWLRPKVLPPRAPRLRSCKGVLIKEDIRVVWHGLSSDTTFALLRKTSKYKVLTNQPLTVKQWFAPRALFEVQSHDLKKGGPEEDAKENVGKQRPVPPGHNGRMRSAIVELCGCAANSQ